MSDQVAVSHNHTVARFRDYDGNPKRACVCAVYELDDGEITDGRVPPSMPTQGDECPHDYL